MASSVSSTTSTAATTTADAAAAEEESNFLAESQDYTVGSGFEFDSPDAQIADTMSGTSAADAEVESEVDVASNWGLAAAKPGQGRAQDRSAGRAHVDGESSVLFAGETEETETDSSDASQSTTGEETLSASSDAGSIGNWDGQKYNTEDMEYTV